MSKKATKPDRVQIAPVTLNREVWEYLVKIKTERSCPMGMAIDELYYEWRRLQKRILEIPNGVVHD